MIFTASNAECSNSERMTSAHVSIFKNAADVSTFKECGWFCALAYDERGNRIAYVHCNSAEDFKRIMNPRQYIDDMMNGNYGYPR